MTIPTLGQLQARYPNLSNPELRKAATKRRKNQEEEFDAEEFLNSAETNAAILNKKLKAAIEIE